MNEPLVQVPVHYLQKLKHHSREQKALLMTDLRTIRD